MTRISVVVWLDFLTALNNYFDENMSFITFLLFF